MNPIDDKNSVHTDAMHAGDEHNPTSAVSSPIFQSSASRFDDPDEISQAMAEIAHPDFYGRYASHNTKQCEATIAKLEKTEAAIVTGSGMAAISLVLFSLLGSDDHIVAQFPWLSIFDNPTLSYRTGILKPDCRAYQTAADSVGVDLQSCLFIDDLDRNVQGAIDAGMSAIHFEGVDNLTHQLEEILF